jgi:hypothetical protein
MEYSKFNLFTLFLIISFIQIFKFFVNDHPLILGLFIFALAIIFRIKLVFSYPLLGFFVVLIFILISIQQTFWGLLIYYVLLEGMFWLRFLFAIKDWLQGKG